MLTTIFNRIVKPFYPYFKINEIKLKKNNIKEFLSFIYNIKNSAEIKKIILEL